MANWWDADPVVAPAQTAAATNWWEADPVAEQTVPTPPSRVEAPPEIVKSLAESGKGTRTSIALGGAKVPEDIPLPNVAPEGGAIDRTLTAVGDIPEAVQRGYYGAKTGANILGLETGVLTPQEAAANIAENVKKAGEVPMPESVRKSMEAFQEEFKKAQGWKESFAVMAKYPDVLPSVLGESVSASLLSGGTGALGALTGAVVGSSVPVVGTAAGTTAGLSVGVGLGSAATEYASTLNSFLIEKGYNTSDPEQLQAAFSNPELMAEARKDAAIRGVAVGAFDALTAGIAGKLFGPVKGLFGKTPAGQVVGSVAGSTAEIGSQALGGAGGAAAGQLGTKGEITEPGEIALEAAGEIVPGLGEIAIGSMVQPKAAPAAEAPAPPPAAAPPAPFEVTVRVPAVREGAAPAPSEAPTKEQAEDLEAVAILKGAGLDFDDITAMSSRQRKAEAKRFQEDQDVKPAELTQEEISFFTPQPEAPVAPPSPAPAVEAQGPEGVSPTPSVPPAAPSEIATDLVQQGVPPLEAMQQAAEQRAAAPQPVPVAEPLPSVTPVVGPEPVAEAPKAAPVPVAEAPPAPQPVKAPKAAKPKAPVAFWRAANLDTLVRKMGGVKDVGGDLKAANVPRQLINNKNGRPIEEIALDAIERGYYPDFKAQLEASADTATGNYQPTKEMVERVKADIGTKKLHPDYQEDVEAAKREGEEQFVFGPYLEEAEARAKELSIGKDDPAVRAAATLLANGQATDIDDAFNKILFADAAEIADDWNIDRGEIAAAIGDDTTNEIDEFLMGEGFIARGRPLEADYEPEPLPVSEAGAAIREEGEPAREPTEEGRVEGPRKEVAEPVSVETEEPEEGLTAEEAQQIIDRSLRPGYKVKLSAKTSRFPEGHTLLISSPTERGRASEPFPIENNEKSLRDWIKGVIRINPDQALKAWEVPFKPVSFDDLAQKVLNEKLGPAYKIKDIKNELHIVTPDKKNIKLEKIGFKGGNIEKFADAIDKYKASLEGKPEAPVEEKGAEGKPQMVIPGAEKISDKELAERKAEAPMRAKVEQKEVGGLFSDERLQQDIFDSAKKEPEPPKAETPKLKKQPMEDWLINYARKNDVIPIFSNDEVGLVFQFQPNTGRQMYRAVEFNKKTGRIVRETKKDIWDESLKGELAKQEPILLKARADAIKADNEYLAQNPDGPFAKGDIVVSKNYPEKLAKVATAWAKMANLPKGTRILFMAPEDAYEMDLAGPYRYINEAKKRLGRATGAKTEVPAQMGIKKFNFIVLKDGISIVRQLESLSHEIGHVMEEELWKSIPQTVKLEMKDAFIKWRAKASKGRLKDLVSNRAYRGQQVNLKWFGPTANLPISGNISASDLNYALSFSEFFADQISRYFTSEAKPLTAVDRAFKRIADALRRFYASITGQKYVSDAAFKNWLDAHIESGIQANQNLAEDLFEVITVEQRDMFDRSPTPTYTVPKEGFGSQFMYYLVDKYNDASSVQRAMEAARGSKLPDNLDVEMSIQLMQDKAIAKQQKFYDSMVRPMVAFMQAHKITGDEAGRFLYAQHAPERNLRMAQRDQSRFDGTNGSGLTTQEALDYIAEIPADRRALLERLYKDHVRKILDADLEYRVNNGLLTDEQYDSYTQPFDRGGYDHYVPLQGYAEDGSDLEPSEADPFIPNIGKGFAVWGKEYKLAAGRTSKAMNPLYSAIQKNMDGIVRVEKNKTDKVLYDLIRKNPNPEIATIHSDKDLPKRAVLRADGTIQYVPDFSLARAEETLPLKIGGRQHYIVFNRDNPTAKRLVHVLKGLTGDQMNIFSRALLATGRFMSNINTQWVPDFFITNMPRDVQDALISIYSNKEGFATNFVKEFMRSGNIVRKVAMKQPLSAEEQAHYDEWIESGGRLDFGGFATIEKTAEKLQEEFGDLFDSGRTSAETLQRYFQKSGNATLGAVERFNQMFDDVVRFSVYRAARRDPNNRYTKERAAQLARRATVDFRQRGAAMPYVNALYPYLSAGINGQRNFLRVLKSRRGRTVLGSLMLLGIANSLLGLALSEDDETDPTKKKFYTQVNQWERAKSFIIPVPINGKYRKVSLGFMGLFVFGLGDQIVGYLSGNVKAGDAAVNVGTSLLSSFVPFWSGGAVDSVTPWVLQPVIELWTNKNWIGNPIYPDRDSRMPQSSQALSTTPDWAKSAAQFANDWSGGSHTQPGWVDVYPATLDYFAKFVTQGLGTFATASYEPFRAFMNGEDLNAEKLPVLRRVTTKDSAERSSYYDIRNDIKAGVAQARELRKIIMDPKADKEMKDDARATMRNLTKELGITFDADGVRVKNSIADIFDKTDDRLKKLNDEIKAIQSSDKYTTQEKAEKVKLKEETKKNIMNSARKRYLQKNKPPPSPIDEMLQ